MSTEQKVTPWFDGSVEPLRTGVYRLATQQKACWAVWTGLFWLKASATRRGAWSRVGKGPQHIETRKPLAWCGLAQ
jgi:hypothetical protein